MRGFWPVWGGAVLAMMTSCGGGNPETRTGSAEARAAAKALLLDPKQAFLERADYVIDDETLLEPALDQILRNVEFWLNRDPHLLDQQLRVQADMARKEMLGSNAGIRALSRKASARFFGPVVRREMVSIPGVPASAFEKKLSEIAGVVLSGRTAQARDIPAGSYLHVEADYGLLPAPLEPNSRAKGYVSPLRYREGDGGGWLGGLGNPPRHEMPALPVIARCARELMQQHPDASRLSLRLIVLRRMGQPVDWRFQVEPSGGGAGFVIRGEGRSPGFDEKIEPLRWTGAELESMAAKAPATGGSEDSK